MPEYFVSMAVSGVRRSATVTASGAEGLGVGVSRLEEQFREELSPVLQDLTVVEVRTEPAYFQLLLGMFAGIVCVILNDYGTAWVAAQWN